MSWLRGLLAILGALAGETMLARWFPTAVGLVDLMLLPVLWYALKGAAPSAMLAGTVGGLAQDAWFGAGVFGISGFKKTFLGWLLAGLGTRVDLNHATGRFLGGFALAVGDRALQLGLCRLLDVSYAPFDPGNWGLRGLLLGLLAVVTVPIIERWGQREPRRRRRPSPRRI